MQEVTEKEINTGIKVETKIEELLVFLRNQIAVHNVKEKPIPKDTSLVLQLGSLLRRKQSRQHHEGLIENANGEKEVVSEKTFYKAKSQVFS